MKSREAVSCSWGSAIWYRPGNGELVTSGGASRDDAGTQDGLLSAGQKALKKAKHSNV